jgi:predicted nucleic acid-binding protein
LILIDTSAFIEFLNRTGSREDQIIEKLISNNEELALPDVALTEILQGIRDDEKYTDVKSSLLTFSILSLKSQDSYIAAADLYRKCRKKGATIRNTVDVLVAQISIEHKTTLLHKARDFEAIAKSCDLKIYKKLL